MVLDAITTPIPEISETAEPTPLSPIGSGSSSPTLVNKKPQPVRSGLEMITNALRNTDNPALYPIEVRVNICTFLTQLSRATSGQKLAQVQAATRPILEQIKEARKEKEMLLTNAAIKVLDLWK